MRTRKRFVLASCIGLISLLLMLWDIHNQSVIVSMGMRWDMGAPVWPYQTAEILFLLLNLPAYVVVNPVLRQFHMFVPQDYLLRFPVAVLWWYVVGMYFDYRVPRPVTWRTLRLTVCAGVAVAFGGIGVFVLSSAVEWWRSYGDWNLLSQYLIFLRAIAPAIWSFAFAVTAILGFRSVRRA
jgi:hypothetical protein